jgi:hypothetical protein
MSALCATRSCATADLIDDEQVRTIARGNPGPAGHAGEWSTIFCSRCERDIDRQPLRGKRDYNFAVRLKAVRQFGIRRT